VRLKEEVKSYPQASVQAEGRIEHQRRRKGAARGRRLKPHVSKLHGGIGGYFASTQKLLEVAAAKARGEGEVTTRSSETLLYKSRVKKKSGVEGNCDPEPNDVRSDKRGG